MKEKIKVVQCGIGAMGSGCVRLILKKEGMEIVGAVDINKDIIGKDLGEVLGVQKLGVTVSEDFRTVFSEVKADVAIYTTVTSLKDLYPQISPALESGANVISAAEELSFPFFYDPELAKTIDNLAKKYKTTVLGTGSISFVDELPIFYTGFCQDVKKIKITRILDYSLFGPFVMEDVGIGLTEDEFRRKVADGSLVGVPFEGQVAMIADSWGLELDEIRLEQKPIIAKTPLKTDYIEIEKGNVAGFSRTYCGIRNGKDIIALEYTGLIHPEKQGIEVSDSIQVEGVPNINVYIKGGVPGGLGTVGILVNMIPRVIDAEPGLVTVKDLPVPSAILGDVRKLVKKKKKIAR